MWYTIHSTVWTSRQLSKRDVTPGDGEIFPHEAHCYPSPACPPPSELTPWLFSLARATSNLRLHIFIIPQKPSTVASNVRGPPGSFSRPSPRPRLSSSCWPLVDQSVYPCASASLTHECGQGRARKGLDANRRQQICNSALWLSDPPRLPLLPPHPPPYTGAGTVISMIEDVREGQMCIHTNVSCLQTLSCTMQMHACVQRVCGRESDAWWLSNIMSENSLEFELIKGKINYCAMNKWRRRTTQCTAWVNTQLYSLNDRISKKKLNQDVESNTDLVRSIASISRHKNLSGSEPI